MTARRITESEGPYRELQDVLDRVPAAVREGASIIAGYVSTSSVAEVADCAHDQLGDWLCYLDPEGEAEAYAAITREVLARAGLDSGASDGSDLSLETVYRIAGEPFPEHGFACSDTPGFFACRRCGAEAHYDREEERYCIHPASAHGEPFLVSSWTDPRVESAHDREENR